MAGALRVYLIASGGSVGRRKGLRTDFGDVKADGFCQPFLPRASAYLN